MKIHREGKKIIMLTGAGIFVIVLLMLLVLHLYIYKLNLAILWCLQ